MRRLLARQPNPTAKFAKLSKVVVKVARRETARIVLEACGSVREGKALWACRRGRGARFADAERARERVGSVEKR
ncbi:hypothetical protein D6817_01950 [Candidatus Pacearchaeota archaeon]|nr:MAG: hypothetical protein D6817_01950 [Candidatus Pacearchaeota archaeon]